MVSFPLLVFLVFRESQPLKDPMASVSMKLAPGCQGTHKRLRLARSDRHMRPRSMKLLGSLGAGT
jgi:hypothetical protein